MLASWQSGEVRRLWDRPIAPTLSPPDLQLDCMEGGDESKELVLFLGGEGKGHAALPTYQLRTVKTE